MKAIKIKCKVHQDDAEAEAFPINVPENMDEAATMWADGDTQKAFDRLMGRESIVVEAQRRYRDLRRGREASKYHEKRAPLSAKQAAETMAEWKPNMEGRRVMTPEERLAKFIAKNGIDADTLKKLAQSA